MVRPAPATNIQLGFVRHAALVTVAEKLSAKLRAKGPGAIDLRQKQPNAMHEGHDLWLSTLKQRSEN
jgi:hypothetical protein